MSLAVDFVLVVSRRTVADSAEILFGRLVMEGWLALVARPTPR